MAEIYVIKLRCFNITFVNQAPITNYFQKMLVLCIYIRNNEENLEFHMQIKSWVLLSLTFKFIYIDELVLVFKTSCISRIKWKVGKWILVYSK
jgi:hypothetical protein